ncbi:MAG: NAD(P)H-dependent oxidoreductase [Spirochaetota bacterium]
MTASVILGHPYVGSFNHAIYERVRESLGRAGIGAFCHDLYAEGFDPVMTVDELGKVPSVDPLVLLYTKELIASDCLIFIHPNWWGQPPAILKGYVDRVMRPPHAYDLIEGQDSSGVAVGRLGQKTAMVFNTSNTPADREDSYFHDPLEYIWGRCIFGFCGIEKYRRIMFRVVDSSSPEDRRRWLDEVEDCIAGALR